MHPFLNMGVLREPDAPGGGGGNPPPPAAFDTAAQNAFFSRIEQSFDAKIKAAFKQHAPPAPQPAPPEPPAPPAPPQPGPLPDPPQHPAKPLPDPRVSRLEEQLAAEKAKREDSENKSEEKDRHGNVRGFLSDFQFASDRAREDAFRTFASEIKRGEDGETLVGPTGEPAAEYIRKMLEGDRDYLLKTRDVSGSGASNTGLNRIKPIDLNDIKPGMKPEDLERARTEISRVALAALRGQ